MNFFLLIIVFFPVIVFAQNPPDTLWTKTFGGNLDETARSIEVTNDGGYIFVGTTGPFNASDIILIKDVIVKKFPVKGIVTEENVIRQHYIGK